MTKQTYLELVERCKDKSYLETVAFIVKINDELWQFYTKVCLITFILSLVCFGSAIYLFITDSESSMNALWGCLLIIGAIASIIASFATFVKAGFQEEQKPLILPLAVRIMKEHNPNWEEQDDEYQQALLLIK